MCFTSMDRVKMYFQLFFYFGGILIKVLLKVLFREVVDERSTDRDGSARSSALKTKVMNACFSEVVSSRQKVSSDSWWPFRFSFFSAHGLYGFPAKIPFS